LTQQSRGRRRGVVFSVRVTEEERAQLDALQQAGGGPRALGPWLIWNAIAGTTAAGGTKRNHSGITRARRRVVPARADSPLILDLCGGTGAWSAPYRDAGYRVQIVDTFAVGSIGDVRLFVPPADVHGVLAAPPCTEFSIARNGYPERPRDFLEGMSVVNACMRIILQCRPKWWALENPTGHLSKFLGIPRDTWEPCDFGDPWTKRTSIWGEFTIPKRGPFVEPTESAMRRSSARARAITPSGFARAFFEANP
jgi:hypothetical protein